MATNATTTAAAEQTNFNQQAAGTPASLYVGDLDPAVTEAILFEVFNSIGPVASIRVCRDTVTRRSLGYGYVNFLNIADAERAIETLNYAIIRNSPVRIMWSNRDPAVRKTGSGNIFIKNLDPSIDHKALHDTFSAFGNILSCKVAMDGDSSKGHGFVHYETMEQAEAAIKAVNGMLLNDRQVFVGLHVSRKERESKLEEMKSHFTNVFVKNLDVSIDEEKFREMFEVYGPITSCQLSKDENGLSKEFGFINYEDHEGAQAAVEALHAKEFMGKELFVGRAQKKSEREEDLRRQYEKIREEKLSQHQGSISLTKVSIFMSRTWMTPSTKKSFVKNSRSLVTSLHAKSWLMKRLVYPKDLGLFAFLMLTKLLKLLPK
jgi:polyadenylate-binding protein